MKLITFKPIQGQEKLGVLLGGKVIDLAFASKAYREVKDAKMPVLPADMMTFLNQGDEAIGAARKIIDWFQRENQTTFGFVYNLDQVILQAPVPRPPKILCLALNYIVHVGEANAVVPANPIVFIKPGFFPVVGPGDKVFRPPQSQNFVFEGELAIVIGKKCRSVPKDKAYEVIAGYTAINDMSCRDLLKTNIPGLVDWFQGKAFDTSLPMGPCLTLKDEVKDPHNLRLTVRVNGETAQDSSTSEMLFKIPEIIEFLTKFVTLEPGDIIATGTPGGSRGVKQGDRIDVEISSIGTLSSVIADKV